MTPLYTRRNYIRTAKLFNDMRPQLKKNGEGEFISYTVDYVQLVNSFCDLYANDNPRFDREKFLEAIGPPMVKEKEPKKVILSGKKVVINYE